jgi:hypothetical protein
LLLQVFGCPRHRKKWQKQPTAVLDDRKVWLKTKWLKT